MELPSSRQPELLRDLLPFVVHGALRKGGLRPPFFPSYFYSAKLSQFTAPSLGIFDPLVGQRLTLPLAGFS